MGVFQPLAANSPFFTLFSQIFLDDLLFFCSTPFFPSFYTPKKFFVPLKIFCPPKNSFTAKNFFADLFSYIVSIFVFRYNVNFAAPQQVPPRAGRSHRPPATPLVAYLTSHIQYYILTSRNGTTGGLFKILTPGIRGAINLKIFNGGRHPRS